MRQLHLQKNAMQSSLINFLLKQKQPESLTIPCSIGNLSFQKSIYDSGASINLMPLSIYRKLGLGEAR